jgi:hypothetical protein
MKQPLITSTKKLTIEGQIIKQSQTIEQRMTSCQPGSKNKINPERWKQENESCQLRAKL